MIAAQWVTPLKASSDPLTTISTEFERGIEVLLAQQPILGCPLNNLAKEMNPLDAGFRARTTQVFQAWRDRDHTTSKDACRPGTGRISEIGVHQTGEPCTKCSPTAVCNGPGEAEVREHAGIEPGDGADPITGEAEHQ
jgi:hypothetical protein